MWKTWRLNVLNDISQIIIKSSAKKSQKHHERSSYIVNIPVFLQSKWNVSGLNVIIQQGGAIHFWFEKNSQKIPFILQAPPLTLSLVAHPLAVTCPSERKQNIYHHPWSKHWQVQCSAVPVLLLLGLFQQPFTRVLNSELQNVTDPTDICTLANF